MGHKHQRQRCDGYIGYIGYLSNVGYKRNNGYDSDNRKRPEHQQQLSGQQHWRWNGWLWNRRRNPGDQQRHRFLFVRCSAERECAADHKRSRHCVGSRRKDL
jgi:hypothetical protein